LRIMFSPVFSTQILRNCIKRQRSRRYTAGGAKHETFRISGRKKLFILYYNQFLHKKQDFFLNFCIDITNFFLYDRISKGKSGAFAKRFVFNWKETPP